MADEQKITNNIKVPNQNMEVLKKHFGHCFDKNGAFDLEKFKQELSENEMDFSKESYGLDWLGKSYARLLASDEAKTLLKEDEAFNQKPENKDSQNLLIKGDNLEVLKHLSNAYYDSVKMIYIDPPYNTGDDGFVYADDRKFTVNELQQLAGIDEEKAKRILDFTQSKSNSHSAWLTFMYPRLYIAKQLLKKEGVIFISIDENEVAQLRLLMDEIFGEENCIGNVTRVAKTGGAKGTFFTPNIDFLLIYGKNKDLVTPFRATITKEQIRTFYKKKQNGGKKDGELYGEERLYKASLDARPNQRYWIKCPDGSLVIPPGKVFPEELEEGAQVKPNSDDGVWKWIYKTYKEEFDKGNIVFKKTKTSGLVDSKGNKAEYNIYNKLWLKEQQAKGKIPANFMMDFENRQSSRELENLGIPFSYAKPTKLIKHLIQISKVEANDIILDFFAGSGTTGDAVMQLNVEDGNIRKFIVAQLPELLNKKIDKSAYDFVKEELKAEKPTIFEITKERLIRAAKKIKNETITDNITEKKAKIKELEGELDLEDKAAKIEQLKQEIESLNNQDLGFRIFETMPIWEDYGLEADEQDKQTKLFDESKLTEDDLKALLTTWKANDGIALTVDLEATDLAGYTGYHGKGNLYLMHKGFDTNQLKALLEKIDSDKAFNPTSVIAFGYQFESKSLREIGENIKSYANKKNIDIDFIIRY